jgi:hypothetical protein
VHRVALVALVGCGRFGFHDPLIDAASPASDVAADAALASDGTASDGASDARAIDARPLDAPPPCAELAISDDFSDGVRGAQWTLIANNPVTVAETGGQLQVTLASSGGSHYGGYDSASLFDLRDHCMRVSYITEPTNEANVEMDFLVRNASMYSIGFVYHSGVIDPFYNNGTFTSFGAVTFDPVADKVLRISESNGNMTWETSPDGTTFTTLTTQPTPIDVSSVTIALEAGTYASAPSPGTAAYANFNVP